MMAPTQPQYVANWIFDRIQAAPGEDAVPLSAEFESDHHPSASNRRKPKFAVKVCKRQAEAAQALRHERSADALKGLRGPSELIDIV
jgi:hypothetical protein